MAEAAKVVAEGGIAAQTGADAPAAVTARPEWLPEKFWDATKGEGNYQGLAASYAELERGKSSAPDGDENNAESTTDDDNADAEAAEAALGKVGLDLSEFTEEWEKNGVISDESYKKLEDRGFGKDTVDTFIAGAEARRNGAKVQGDAIVKAGQEIAGGPEGYKDLINWAGSNLTAEQVGYFNEQVNTADATKVNAAVEWLMGKHTEAEGGSPRLLSGGNAPSSNSVFTSWSDVESAMAKTDPNTGKNLYKNSPEYRGEIEAKLQRSSI